MKSICTIVNSIFNSCTYIVNNEQEDSCIIIDCGDISCIYDYIKLNNLCISAVLLTHAHFDHIYGLNRLLELNPETVVYTNYVGREMLLNEKLNFSRYHDSPFVFSYPERVRLVDDGELLNIGNLQAKVVFTPGHSNSCITWIIEDCVFSGDSYIPGIKVVTNLPGCNKYQAFESVEKILAIATGKQLYPGHPSTF